MAQVVNYFVRPEGVILAATTVKNIQYGAKTDIYEEHAINLPNNGQEKLCAWCHVEFYHG